eukprot:CAMPEP_0197022730 /NCGR_PEP_ID=MMETSP1384-20130603/3549_1 /TAXON_ID=29189 /ORGANISM="Ammonia sp." /LENGTH=455 /DNA_ID=CAMNT_0042450821 /DNA_START=121 /DNA_END=1488 /DNA_ORIENTATION=-
MQFKLLTSKRASSSSVMSRNVLHHHQHGRVHTKFAIVGGGTGGMNTAAQLIESNTAHPSEITVFDPSRMHYYQPGFTMVAGGVLGNDELAVRRQLGGYIQKPMSQVFDSNVRLVPDAVGEYEPDQNKLYTATSGTAYTYDYLVVCSGVELRYDLIDGALDALNDPKSNVGSMYKLEYALKMNHIRSHFKGGKVIATQPPMPFKCGGAPQKFIYLTEHQFRLMGIRDKIESFKFYTHLHTMFGVKKYDRELRKLVEKKGITPVYQHELIKVEDDKKLAWFKNVATDEIVSDSYDFLNICPPQKPNAATASAPFSNAAGYVDVDMHTLQSSKYDNVFSIGDANSCPNPKTAAAIFAGSPTLIANINHVMKREKVVPSFDGYASCPIFVGDGKLMLAEFIYGGVPKETFAALGWDQGVPKKAFYYLKRDFFPFAYWNVAPKGKWYGTTLTMKPKLKAL